MDAQAYTEWLKKEYRSAMNEDIAWAFSMALRKFEELQGTLKGEDVENDTRTLQNGT